MTETRFDHRPLVAALRREKMHMRLIEAALLAIAEKGIERTVIEDVIAVAGVSRGTFYNHFSDVNELMLSARDTLVDEWLDLTLSAVAELQDPAENCAVGIKSAMAVSRAYPLLARFHAMIGVNVMRRGNLVSVLVPPILLRGMTMGRFWQMPTDQATDYISGIILAALQRQAAGQPVDEVQMIAAILRLLSLPSDEALALARRPARPVLVPPDSLIARSDQAMRCRMARQPEGLASKG